MVGAVVGDELGLFLGHGGLGGKRLLLPEAKVALGHAAHPRRKEATGNLVGPTAALFIIGRQDTATGSLLNDPDAAIDDDERHDTSNKAIGNGVAKGHHGEGKESRDGVAEIPPVDFDDGRGHHGADNDENTASGPWGDGGKDGSEKDGDEEAEARHHGRETCLAAFGNTRTGFNKSSDGRNTKDGTDGDADGIGHVGEGGAFEILGDGVDEAGEASHGVEGTGAVENIDIEKGDEGKAKLATILADIPFLNVENVLDRVESDDLFEKVESIITDGGVREVGDGGRTGPGDDADEEDAHDDGALDAVEHEHDGEDAAAKDANPHGGVAHLVGAGTEAGLGVEEGGVAAGELEGGGLGADNDTNAAAVGEADEGEVEANADAGGELDGGGDGTGEPLSHTKEGETKEDEALDKDGGKGDTVGDGAGAVEANDGVSKVGVEAHAGGEADGHVGEEAHEEASNGGDGGGGGDDVALDFLDTEGVVLVGVANGVVGAAIADTGTTGIGDDGSIDGDDVGHGEEGG